MKDQLRHKTILTNKTENYTRILLKIYVCNIYNSKFVSLLPKLLQCRIALTSGFTCLIEGLGQVCQIIWEWNTLKRYKEKEEPVENLQKQNIFFFSNYQLEYPNKKNNNNEMANHEDYIYIQLEESGRKTQKLSSSVWFLLFFYYQPAYILHTTLCMYACLFACMYSPCSGNISLWSWTHSPKTD